MSMLSGVIDVVPIARAHGRQRANTLPALHTFSGADTVGKFNQLGKAAWLNIFMKFGSDINGVLEQLLIVREASTGIGSPQTAHYTCPYPNLRIGTGQYRITRVLRPITEWILQRRRWGPGTAYN